MELYIIGILAVFYVALAFMIAHSMGRKKRIGFLISFLYSLANPVLGLAMTLSSKDKKTEFELKRSH